MISASIWEMISLKGFVCLFGTGSYKSMFILALLCYLTTIVCVSFSDHVYIFSFNYIWIILNMKELLWYWMCVCAHVTIFLNIDSNSHPVELLLYTLLDLFLPFPCLQLPLLQWHFKHSYMLSVNFLFQGFA